MISCAANGKILSISITLFWGRLKSDSLSFFAIIECLAHFFFFCF